MRYGSDHPIENPACESRKGVYRLDAGKQRTSKITKNEKERIVMEKRPNEEIGLNKLEKVAGGCIFSHSYAPDGMCIRM